MKRIDSDMSEESLIRLMEEDVLDRNAEIKELVELLKSVEGGFTFFLDAPWGEGKTVFVKQLKMVLEGLAPQLDAPPEVDEMIGDGKAFPSMEDEYSMLPVYSNAWENDYYDDPLPSVLKTIACGSAYPGEAKRDSETSEKIIASRKRSYLGIFT